MIPTLVLSNNINKNWGKKNGDEYSDTHEAVIFDHKQLMIFAGPSSCASTSFIKFYSQYASGHGTGHPHTLAMRYWLWPKKVTGDSFERLVTNPNDERNTKTITETKKAFDESQNGVIIGTSSFDQIGIDAKYDGLSAMKQIVDKIGVPNEYVTVIVNYRVPRVDQWYSLYKHSTNNGKYPKYDAYMCVNMPKEDGEYNHRYDAIGSMMNPLGNVLAYLEQGYNVKLVDMGGVDAAGKDINHVIGCDVFLGECDKGSLGKLQHRLPHENVFENDFDELPVDEQDKIEVLFRSRDCAYQGLLEKYVSDGLLEILYRDSLWEDCSDHDEKYYNKFIDNTPTLFQALRSQVNCEEFIDEENFSSMDSLLKLGGGNKKGGTDGGKSLFGAFVETVFMLAILLVAIGYGVYMVQEHNNDKGYGGEMTVDGGDGGTEMTPYPSTVGQLPDDDDQFEDEEHEFS